MNDGTSRAVEAQLRLFDDRIRDLSATLQKFRRLRNLEPVRLGPGRPAGALQSALSDRELAILRLIAEGRANDEIAVALHFGLGTIKLHVREILDKLGVPTRAAAAARAVRLGLI